MLYAGILLGIWAFSNLVVTIITGMHGGRASLNGFVIIAFLSVVLILESQG